MEPVIEILTRNILSDRRFKGSFKKQFIYLINRMDSFKTSAQQLYRQNAFHILFNAFHEEILFLINQKKKISKLLTGNVLLIFNDLIDTKIQLYNHYLNKL